MVELDLPGISLEWPNIEVDIFPLSEEQEEPLFCAETGPVFEEGFTEEEIAIIQQLIALTGENFDGVIFWRAEGAPPSYIANASVDGSSYITLHDQFFLQPLEGIHGQIAILLEELIHLQQVIEEVGFDTAQQIEDEAAELVDQLLKGKK